jgi:RNA polymerase sigma-70 factor, ECF subfamily
MSVLAGEEKVVVAVPIPDERAGAGAEASFAVTDSDLVERIRRGDEAAFQEMVGRHSGELFGLAFSLLGNAADAEDVVQQSFLGAFQRINSFENRSSLKTWLVSIVVNQSSKARRSKRVRRAVSLDGGGDATSGEAAHARANGEDAGALGVRPPSAAVDSRADVATMLETLSPEFRDVIVLRELQRMTYDEIAESLRIPRGTVESRLFRARRDLRKKFAGYFG